MILNSHDSLTNYYLTNFNLMYYLGDKHLNPIEWDNTLLPFEKMIYLELLNSKLAELHGKDEGLPYQGEPTKEEFEGN